MVNRSAAGDPLVGRRQELEAAAALLNRTAGGDATAVAVVGEPGIGKTRLLGELATRAHAAGFQVLAGRGSGLGTEIPFGPVVEALDGAVAALDRAQLQPLGPQRLAELATILPSLDPEPTDAEAQVTLDVERFRAYHAVRALLQLLSDRRPLLLVFDDLHWADQATLELLAYMLRLHPRRCLLALAYRRLAPRLLVGTVGRAAHEGCLQILDLTPLSVGEVAELVGGEFSGPSLDALYTESGGNPLYARQLARAFRRRSKAFYTAAGMHSAPPADVPRVLQRTIAQDLARLSPVGRELAYGAAVLGDPFEPATAAEVADVDEARAYPLLDELIAAEAVRPTEVPGRFQFWHPIVRRAVYDAAGPGWRLRAHRRAARALQRQGAPLAVQAEHTLQSGAAIGDEQAIGLLTAAANAAAGQAPVAAARWLAAAAALLPADAPTERHLAVLLPRAAALAGVGRLQESRSALSQAMGRLSPVDADAGRRIAVMLSGVERGLGHEDRARGMLERALATTDTGSPEAGQLALELAKNHIMSRAWDLAAAATSQAHDIARAHGDQVLRLGALATRAAFPSWGPGDIVLAATDTDTVAAEIDALTDDEISPPLLEVLAYLAYAEATLERWSSAESHADRGLRICRATGQGLRYVELLRPLATVQLRQGRLAESRRTAETLAEAAQLLGDDCARLVAEALCCWVAALEGRTADAMAAGDRAVEAATRSPHAVFGWMAHLCSGVALLDAGQHDAARLRLLELGGPELTEVPPASRTHWLRALAEAEIGLGRIEDAEATTRRAETLAGQLGLPLRTGDARYCRAATLLALEEHGRAADAAHAAAAAYDESQVPVEAARSRLLAARALVAAGDRTGAVADLESALAVLEPCGALRLADRAAQELRQLGRAHRRPRATVQVPVGADLLSKREREVAALAARGHTNRQIAEELYLSRKTVETHLAHVFAKLGVSSRAAMAAAIDHTG